MAAKKVGDLIKEARTGAGLSQESLAKQIDGLSASDIGKAERGEKDLTQAQLKAIAKATGVTQKSLLEAPKGSSAGTAKKSASEAKTTAKKSTSEAKTTARKSTSEAKSGTAKKSGTTAKKTGSASSKKSANTVELTAAEKTLLNAYRKADAERQKTALKLLKGEQSDDLLSSLLSGAMDMLGNLGKK